ncbi:MAG: Gfo/Idh/MocA family oxidoreductase [Clostridiales bacterium]|nr:Gfo/Idh/MocA family oxidoreductase [Clostridiales bacterium]
MEKSSCTEKPFGWAFIGCGGIAAGVAEELLKDGGGRIVACWNRTKSRAEKFAARFGCAATDTAEQAITYDGVEGVYVATTHDVHGYFTRLAVSLGVPVLCEKPFTVNAREAREVFDFAREKNVYASEAMWTWHNKPAHIVRDWVKSGRVGEIKRASVVYAFPLTAIYRNPRLTSPDLIGGALLDIGIYPVRYMYELFGMPQNISAEGELKGGVDVSEKITMDYGAFRAELSVSMEKLMGEKLVIEGSDGKITVPFFHMAKRGRLSGKQKEKFKIDDLLYGTQFRQVAEEIRSGKKESAFCPRQSTIDTMTLLDECRRQLGVVYPCEK